MKLDYTAKLEQAQKLTQNQLQSLKILSLDNCELNEFLQNEYLDNPMMEYTQAITLSSWNQSHGAVSDEDTYHEIPDERQSGIKDFLLEQLNRQDFTDLQWSIMEILIDCLDENGFFKLSIKEVSQWLHIEKVVVENCLNTLSALEPAGIFAKDFSHCLLLQLERNQALTPLLETLIHSHLDDIAEGKINVVAKALSVSVSDIRKEMGKVRKLNPRPIAPYTVSPTRYIVPDVILSYDNYSWNIQLNDQWISNYSVSDCYLNMMQSTQNPELKEYLRQKYYRYQLLMNNIEQRRDTIQKISYSVFEHQKDYFVNQGPLKPLTLSDIANDIHMHPSTISRGIRNKYLQYPNGVVRFKDLFVSGLGDTYENSSEHAKVRIKFFIDSESPKKPYSDSALVSLLKKENITISRRTVTKYREELGIPSTYCRKSIG